MIRMARETDTHAVIDLWDICFPDDHKLNAYFFKHQYSAMHTVLLWEGQALCAMTQMLPYKLRLREKTATATYIYGACTAPEARRHGYMSELLEWSFAADCAEGRIASILIPQEPWLFDFYAQFGYKAAFYTDNYTIETAIPNTLVRQCTLNDYNAMSELYQSVTESCAMVLQRTAAEWCEQICLFEKLGQGVFGLFHGSEMLAYAFVWKTESELWAQEVMSASKTHENALCSAVRALHNDAPMSVTTMGEATALGCAKLYCDTDESGYMNLLFN